MVRTGIEVLILIAVDLPLDVCSLSVVSRSCRELRATCSLQMQAEHVQYMERTTVLYLAELAASSDSSDSDSFRVSFWNRPPQYAASSNSSDGDSYSELFWLRPMHIPGSTLVDADSDFESYTS